jgi:hypothetical protein
MPRARALLVALAVAATVFSLRWSGVLNGLPAVAFAVLLALSLPWSAHLSRRLLLAGALFLGWMPLLWWVRLPVHDVDRVGLTLALAAGAVAGWTLWTPDVRVRARRLIPRVGAVDALPLTAAAVAVWTTWPLLAASGGERTLDVLMKQGFDHAAHFAMVILIRTEGAIGPLLGAAPDGASWKYATYPQHFHATVTALTELWSGPLVGDAAKEVLMYGRSLALLQVLTAALLAAGVAQLPSLRRRALLAWPLAATVVAAFLFGPGSAALANGFPNFVLACATVGLAALLALPMRRELAPLRVFALGGLVVASVHGWALLAPLAVVAASVACVPFTRARRPRSRAGLLTTIAALAATAAASAAVVPMLVPVRGVEILTIVGALVVFMLLVAGSLAFVPSSSARWPRSRAGLLTVVAALMATLTATAAVVLLVSAGGLGILAAAFPLPFTMSHLFLASGMALVVALAASVRGRGSESALKGLMLAAVPGAGLLLLGLLAAYQLLTAGELSYYFGKLAIAVTLISVVALAAGVALHVGPPSSRRGRSRRLVATTASVVATLAVLQLFGYVGPGRLLQLMPGLDVAQGLQYRANAMALREADASASRRLLQATAIARSRPFATTTYVAAVPGDTNPTLSEFWKRALSLTWSSRTSAVVDILQSVGVLYAGVDQAAEVTGKLLEEAPQGTVVVAPEIADEVRSLLPVGLRDRVITWEVH